MYLQSFRNLAFFTLTASIVLLGQAVAEPIPAVSANPLSLAARSLEKRHDCHGSAYRGSAGKQQIGNAITAMSGWLSASETVQKAYGSHAKKSSDGYGMTAIFACNSDDDYANSIWTGRDIFNGMINVYAEAYVLSLRILHDSIWIQLEYNGQKLFADMTPDIAVGVALSGSM
ncbi:MAG: hypothetical protein Q9218_003437 [Villophora microphyllina]